MTNSIEINPSNFNRYNSIVPYIRYSAVDKYNHHWILKERVIGDYEFIMITHGSGIFNFGKNSFKVSKYDFITIPDNVIHSAESRTDEFGFFCSHFLLYANVNFTPGYNLGHEYNEKYPKGRLIYEKCKLNIPYVIQLNNPHKIYERFSALIKEMSKPLNSTTAYVKNLFSLLVFDVLRDFTIKNNAINPYVKKAASFINENYQKKISLIDIAQFLHLSKEYTCSLLKEHTGLTATGLITSKRLFEAKKMIAEGSMTLKEISEKTGFCDIHHFTKCFKEHEGITPGQYRKISG